MAGSLVEDKVMGKVAFVSNKFKEILSSVRKFERIFS